MIDLALVLAMVVSLTGVVLSLWAVVVILDAVSKHEESHAFEKTIACVFAFVLGTFASIGLIILTVSFTDYWR